MIQALKTYDYLVLARQRVLDWTRPLGHEAYMRKFPIGLGSLGSTLTHIMICEWQYVQRMQGAPVPEYSQWPIQDEKPPAFDVLEATWREQAPRTRAALAAIRDWETDVEYQVDWDGTPTIVMASPADIFTQLTLHEVHHRSQAMNMLRQSGVQAEDIDYNTLMYRRRKV